MNGRPVASSYLENAGPNVRLNDLQVGCGRFRIQLLPENGKPDCVEKLESTKRRERQRRIASRGHVGRCPQRMRLLNVKAVQKTGAGVGAQYRPSFASRIACASSALMVFLP